MNFLLKSSFKSLFIHHHHPIIALLLLRIVEVKAKLKRKPTAQEIFSQGPLTDQELSNQRKAHQEAIRLSSLEGIYLVAVTLSKEFFRTQPILYISILCISPNTRLDAIAIS